MKRKVAIAAMALIGGFWACSLSYAEEDAAVFAQGEAVFNKSCTTCHLTGVAGSAKVHDVEAWKQRFSTAKEVVREQNPRASEEEINKLALDYLVGRVKQGVNAMPPKGLCPECTDDEYRAAILFMMHPENAGQ